MLRYEASHVLLAPKTSTPYPDRYTYEQGEKDHSADVSASNDSKLYPTLGTFMDDIFPQTCAPLFCVACIAQAIYIRAVADADVRPKIRSAVKV